MPVFRFQAWRLVAAVAFVACAAPARDTTPTPTLRDDFGAEITLGQRPARIVSLNPTTTELLFAIGASDRLVGRSQWDVFPDSARLIPDVGQALRPNVEAIIAVKPDLVLLYASADNRAAFDRLRQAGIQVEVDAAHTAAARDLNEAFVHYMTYGRPLVTLKAALTLDGKIAAPDDGVSGPTGWITSEVARAHVQTVRHKADAILTGIGTVIADDCRMTDRTGLERSRPLMRIVLDSQLRLPLDSQLVTSCQNDVLVVTTSAASDERRKKLEAAGVRVDVCERNDGRVDLPGVVQLLAREKYLSLMIEAGSRVNWAALETGITDKIFFYYAPKILGGLHSLPVAGGVGRRRRKDALVFENVRLHTIGSDEFAVEAWIKQVA